MAKNELRVCHSLLNRNLFVGTLARQEVDREAVERLELEVWENQNSLLGLGTRLGELETEL